MTLPCAIRTLAAMTTCEVTMPESEILENIHVLKEKLAGQALILGHHYQRDEVFSCADITGDSLKLSQQAATTDVPFIVFCGVHFMAETADILTCDTQSVILPDPAAGCSMADMADDEQITRCWHELEACMLPDELITPVTYINSTASLKAFCGQHGGIVCTSSNARKVMTWAWKQREKILFFPDQHLGENTAVQMGVPDADMIIWDPFQPLGGHSPEAIKQARLILWKGYCSVHQLFKPQDVDTMRHDHVGIQILAHPECSRAVCEASDFIGSTEAIIRYVEQAASGQSFAIGTELNLVNRLRRLWPDKPVYFLSPTMCMCSTMFRTDPEHLWAALRAIAEGKAINRVQVPDQEKRHARDALDKMLELV